MPEIPDSIPDRLKNFHALSSSSMIRQKNHQEYLLPRELLKKLSFGIGIKIIGPVCLGVQSACAPQAYIREVIGTAKEFINCIKHIKIIWNSLRELWTKFTSLSLLFYIFPIFPDFSMTISIFFPLVFQVCGNPDWLYINGIFDENYFIQHLRATTDFSFSTLSR